MEFRELLQKRRKEEGLTQEELAGRLFVSSKTISNWETGKTTPDIDNVIRLANLLQISLNDLLLEGSEMVENIKKTAEIKETKKYLLYTGVINFSFLFIVMTAAILDNLPTIYLTAILLAESLNAFVLVHFSNKLTELTHSGWKYWNRKQKMYGYLSIVVVALLVYGVVTYFRGLN